MALSEELSILECCFFETNNEKFSLRRVKSKKIRGHPGENLSQSGLGVGDTYLSQSYYVDEMRRKVEYHQRKGDGLEKVR